MSLNLALTREKTGVFFLTAVQSDGSPQSLVGSTIYFHAAAQDGFAINKSSPSSGITITDASGGLATLTIMPSDTTALSPTGVYAMPCELTLGNGGALYELNTGTLTITPNVGTP
jgi:hypothetical protein